MSLEKVYDGKGNEHTLCECTDSPSSVDNGIIVARFNAVYQDRGDVIECVSHTPNELIGYLANGYPVLAHIYIGQGDIRTAVCWIYDGRPYVGEWGCDTGWYLDNEDGTLWYEY